MKKFVILTALLGVSFILSSNIASAQGRHGRGHDHDRYENRDYHNDRYNNDRYDNRRGRDGYNDRYDNRYDNRRGKYHNGRGNAYGHYKNKSYHRHGPPAWARAHRYNMDRHVYFPDYYTFYDASRGGYTYWGGNDWIFSQSVPSFMLNVDLGRARIQVMGDVPLGYAPQQYYRKYHKRFPVPRPLVPQMFIPRF